MVADYHLMALMAVLCWPADNVYADVPWSEISENPNIFIDTILFPIPKMDINPSSMNPHSACALAEFFLKYSTNRPNDPFMFQERNAIKAKTGCARTYNDREASLLCLHFYV
jgi:hypothetical protein